MAAQVSTIGIMAHSDRAHASQLFLLKNVSLQFEHTVLITEEGVEILTLPDDAAERDLSFQ